MSRGNPGSGGSSKYFKDLGSFSHQIFNQLANDIRSNAEQLVSAAFQNESCGGARSGQPPETGSEPRDNINNSSRASTPSQGRGHRGAVPSSTSSSQATTPDEVVGTDWFGQVRLKCSLQSVPKVSRNLSSNYHVSSVSQFLNSSLFLDYILRIIKVIILRIFM